MTMHVTATEAKAKLLALLDEVERGEEVVITRRGKVVARLAPPHNPLALKGRFAGVAWTNVAPEELYSTDEEWEAS